MEKEFEVLDKLEECANGMKDLPKSNWIDLANSEAELDLKIMDWVETIKFELFKGKQAITELEQIKNSKPSEALDYLYNSKMFNYKGDEDYFIKQYNTIKQALLKAQEQEKVLEIIFEKEVDVHLFSICVNCFSDSLYAYNKEIEKRHNNWSGYQNKPLSFYQLTQEEFDTLKRWCEKCQK